MMDSKSLWRCLSLDEVQRAYRYRYAKDRMRFAIGRGVLRHILGAYLGADPMHLEFCYNTQGKPALANHNPDDQLAFNVSHSSRVFMYAVARHAKLGIDVEKVRFIPDYEELMQHYFPVEVRSIFRQIPEGERLDFFYRCWTRKEAIAKASGLGLSLYCDPCGPPSHDVWSGSSGQRAGEWHVFEIRPQVGYLAAVAAQGGSRRISCQRWDGGAAWNAHAGSQEKPLVGIYGLREEGAH
jgi:4'-phosphopantetheinyl transferase